MPSGNIFMQSKGFKFRPILYPAHVLLWNIGKRTDIASLLRKGAFNLNPLHLFPVW